MRKVWKGATRPRLPKVSYEELKRFVGYDCLDYIDPVSPATIVTHKSTGKRVRVSYSSSLAVNTNERQIAYLDKVRELYYLVYEFERVAKRTKLRKFNKYTKHWV